MAPIEERYADADGHRLRYLEGGEGDPLLLCHGGLIDAAHCSWGEVIGPLSDRFRVIAPDLLGYGKSDRPEIAYSTKRHVATTESFLDSLGIEDAHAVGLSVGGSVAIGLALRSPDRVDRLVPVASYGLGPELPNGRLTFLLSRLPALNRASLSIARRSRRLTKASLSGIAHDPDALSSEAVDCVHELLQRPDAGRAYRSWRRHEVGSSGFRTDYRSRLPEIDAPTLFVHGRDDEVFPPEWSALAAERMDAACWILPETGHWVPRERPEQFVERLIEFLD
ncbi:MAG: alpha/beta hydrolase [Halalkalicoccus sp.]